MIRSLIRSIVILPGTVLLFVPSGLLWLSAGTPLAAVSAPPGVFRFWLATIAAAAGLALMTWTTVLFVTIGKGTPAPWDPPRKLVVRGPYRHVRNPMISGVMLFLIAEALLFGSWPIAAWAALFLTANAIYFPLSEETGLEQRFGEDYRTYKANVPRWLPRLMPWRQP